MEDNIRCLANGPPGIYIFDMSAIQKCYFDEILSYINQNFSIRVLGFNCDLLYSYSPHKGIHSKVSSSIACLVPNYFNQIVDALYNVLQSSTELKELMLNYIFLENDAFLKLCSSISFSRSLVTLRIENISLGDEKFSNAIKILGKSPLKNIIFRCCNLTDKSLPALKEFFQIYQTHHKNNPLTLLDLSGNIFSTYTLNALSRQQFSSTTNIIINSENRSYNQSSINNFTFTSDEYYWNSELNCDDLKFDNIDENRFINLIENDDLDKKAPKFDDSPLGKLKLENYKLKLTIEKIKCMLEEIQNNHALFIIGPGAQNLIEQMKEIDLRLHKLETA